MNTSLYQSTRIKCPGVSVTVSSLAQDFQYQCEKGKSMMYNRNEEGVVTCNALRQVPPCWISRAAQGAARDHVNPVNGCIRVFVRDGILEPLLLPSLTWVNQKAENRPLGQCYQSLGPGLQRVRPLSGPRNWKRRIDAGRWADHTIQTAFPTENQFSRKRRRYQSDCRRIRKNALPGSSLDSVAV